MLEDGPLEEVLLTHVPLELEDDLLDHLEGVEHPGFPALLRLALFEDFLAGGQKLEDHVEVDPDGLFGTGVFGFEVLVVVVPLKTMKR